jgi:hypothetical protein
MISSTRRRNPASGMNASMLLAQDTKELEAVAQSQDADRVQEFLDPHLLS